MKILVTGGCGFIGSALIRQLLADPAVSVLNVDKLTYAATPAAIEGFVEDARYTLLQKDICDEGAMQAAFEEFAPDAVFHLAAESHVDRSIDGPGEFVRTNVVGTYTMLEAARKYLDARPALQSSFRFLHISTDEVFGELELTDPPFTETSPYQPNSPYSASKASSDHMARAWHETFGLPVIVTNCSNNYGTWQAPEKLIPVVIASLMQGRPVPVYGDGSNIRDWLHVEDHAEALRVIMQKGRPGDRYNIGANNELSNLELVKAICGIFDELFPDKAPHTDSISFVEDRKGHDWRYSVNADKLKRDLGWSAGIGFQSGLRATVEWYIANKDWWQVVLRDTHG